jgi:hypothetical protein
VAKQLQSGVNPNSVSVQPWFETMLGGTGSAFCMGFSSCTVAAVQFDQANGNPYWPSHGAGALWTLIEPGFVTGPVTAANTQVAGIDWNTNRGYSNYHAGFITLRKSATHGLTFDMNYTFAHSLDNLGLTQENTCAVADAFNYDRTYAPSLFDRRHTFNLLLTYDLPLGKGKRWGSNALADKVIGGWSVSGVYTAASGLPYGVVDLNACATEFGSTSANGEPVGLLRTTSGTIGASRVNNPTLTCSPSPSGPGSNSCNGSPNAFGDPAKVAAEFRYPTFADNRLGWGALRGLFRQNVDLALAKRTPITERLSTRFDIQFVNAFNHPMFGGTSVFGLNNEANVDVSAPQSFGVLSKQFNSPRYIQMGLRFDF